jgi:hypothetical protein
VRSKKTLAAFAVAVTSVALAAGEGEEDVKYRGGQRGHTLRNGYIRYGCSVSMAPSGGDRPDYFSTRPREYNNGTSSALDTPGVRYIRR